MVVLLVSFSSDLKINHINQGLSAARKQEIDWLME
jgi:hypothetical protein